MFGSRWKRALLSVLGSIGLLVPVGLAAAGPAAATTAVSASRLAGNSRYGTAAAVAGDASFASAASAVVATGENFPDALAASGLAGAGSPAPIVLTQGQIYTADAKSALAALKGRGVTSVSVVGGSSAVSDDVVSLIRADGFTVTRVAGVDRYATAASIASSAAAKRAVGTVGGLPTAIVATGLNYPDALAGGAISYASSLPLLLVGTDDVPAATRATISSLGIKQAIVLGGTAAVSTTTQSTLESLTGNPVVRLAGSNRFATAVAVGNYETSSLGFPATSAVLATGTNFPDALAAGPLAGQNRAPIVLTASMPAESQAFLTQHSATISKLWVAGGTSAVSDDTVAAAQTAAQGGGAITAGTYTVRPELVSATVVKTVATSASTVTSPAGSTIQYVFDENVNGTLPAPTSFKVYRYADGVGLPASTASADSSNGRAINAFFPSLTTTDTTPGTGTGALSLATVALGAVSDSSGMHNSEGSVPLVGTAASSTTGPTVAPDLLSIGRFGESLTLNVAAVDFRFDQTAYTRGGSFWLVLKDGALVACTAPGTSSTATGGGSDVGGNGTAVITVLCGPVVNGPPTGSSAFGTAGSSTYNGSAPSAANVAWGFVDPNAVATSPSGSAVNPLESTGVVAGVAGGVPALVSASFTPGSTVDSVVYSFDQAVLPPTDATKFRVFMADGSERTATASTQARNSEDVRQVSVSFPSGTLSAASGASVTSGAVVAATGSGQMNQPASYVVNATAGSGSGVVAGRIAGPDLSSVSLTATRDPFGAVNGVNAVYTFDAPVTSSVTTASLLLYLADGTRLQCSTSATASTESSLTTSQVLCSGWTFAPLEAGTNTGTPHALQVHQAVVGTVAAGAVIGSSTSTANPEGVAATTGSTGTISA